MNSLTSFTDSRLAYAVESKSTPRNLARWFSPTVLEVVMLYDEDGARQAGKSLCDRILALLGSRYSIKLLPWKFSVTQFPMLTDIVVRESTGSPFLLVVINGERAMSPEVESLIRRCAGAMRKSGGALVVQLHGIRKDQKESSPVYRRLTQIAEKSKLPIFSTVVELNQKCRGAGRTSPSRSGSPFVAISPPTLPTNS